MANRQRLSILNFILLILFVLWNYYQPLVADDFGRASADILHNNNLIYMLKHDYLNWTGRITAQALAYIFFSQSYNYILIPMVNIFSSLALLYILHKIYFLVNNNKAQYWSTFYALAFSYIAYFVVIGTFSQDFLWKTVAIQYAWGFLLILGILYKFYIDWINNTKASALEIFLYIIAATALGFYNEIYIAFLVDVYITAIITMFLFKYPLKSIFKRQYIIFIIVLGIAALLSIIAPGNYIRKSTYLMSNPHVANTGILMKLAMTYVQFFRYGYHVAFSIILLAIGITVYIKRKTISTQFMKQFVFYIILLNIHILSFVGVAYYSPISGRMLIILDSIIFILLAKSLIEFLSTKPKKSYPKLKVGFYCISILFYTYVTFSYFMLNQFIKSRNAIINNLPNRQTNIIIPAYCANIIFKYPVYFDDIGEDNKNDKNISIALFYKVNSISIKGCKHD